MARRCLSSRISRNQKKKKKHETQTPLHHVRTQCVFVQTLEAQSILLMPTKPKLEPRLITILQPLIRNRIEGGWKPHLNLKTYQSSSLGKLVWYYLTLRSFMVDGGYCVKERDWDWMSKKKQCTYSWFGGVKQEREGCRNESYQLRGSKCKYKVKQKRNDRRLTGRPARIRDYKIDAHCSTDPRTRMERFDIGVGEFSGVLSHSVDPYWIVELGSEM